MLGRDLGPIRRRYEEDLRAVLRELARRVGEVDVGADHGAHDTERRRVRGVRPTRDARLTEEADGVILRRVALVDQNKIGLGITVFVSVESADHSEGWLRKFADAVSAMPEVMEFYRMAGDVDYMLRVVAADMHSYDVFYKKLIGAVPLNRSVAGLNLSQLGKAAPEAARAPEGMIDWPRCCSLDLRLHNGGPCCSSMWTISKP